MHGKKGKQQRAHDEPLVGLQRRTLDEGTAKPQSVRRRLREDANRGRAEDVVSAIQGLGLGVIMTLAKTLNLAT